MKSKWKLHDREYQFACIVWQHEPIASGELTKICEKELQWKRTTTYTVLKKLCDRGILINENTMVRSLVKKEQIQQEESQNFIQRVFDNSFSSFVASFAKERPLSESEIQALRELIDSYEEKV